MFRCRKGLPRTCWPGSRAFSTADSGFQGRGPVPLALFSDEELDANIRMMKAEKQRRQSTLVIGAAGAVGKRLCAALTERGHRVIASDRLSDQNMALAMQHYLGKT